MLKDPNDRISRWVWWLILRLCRRGFAKNFNHKLARHLRPNHAKHFLERGKAQNAFARRHGLALTKLGVGLVEFAFLCVVSFYVAHWLFDHGYFTAPGSPVREL